MRRKFHEGTLSKTVRRQRKAMMKATINSSPNLVKVTLAFVNLAIFLSFPSTLCQTFISNPKTVRPHGRVSRASRWVLNTPSPIITGDNLWTNGLFDDADENNDYTNFLLRKAMLAEKEGNSLKAKELVLKPEIPSLVNLLVNGNSERKEDSFGNGGDESSGKNLGKEGNTLKAKEFVLKPEIPSLVNDNNEINEDSFGMGGDASPGKNPICRVVTLSDGKLPNSRLALPGQLFREPFILQKLDDIYHAKAYDETRHLPYIKKIEEASVKQPCLDPIEEAKLVSVLRNSLEDAGYERLSRRDLDLCEALNADYLLRLSILPDTSQLDPNIAKEFYPERFNAQGEDMNEFEKPLFDGSVLVYRRGYSQEVSKGRLLLPKIDYLQASLVQRSAAWLRKRICAVEQRLLKFSRSSYRNVSLKILHLARSLLELIPKSRLTESFSSRLAINSTNVNDITKIGLSPSDTFFNLGRYGGSKIRFVSSPNPTDALNPFLICEEDDADCETCPNNGKGNILNDSKGKQVEQNIYKCLNSGDIQCPYDANKEQCEKGLNSMQLLQRVTVGNVIDCFSKEGRRKLLKAVFSKSELIEPIYEEVVVIWRPLPKNKSQFSPPKFAYELADMFDIDGLPENPSSETLKPLPLEIRTFEAVPMANIQAVLPKSKLIFRPQDAFVFDLISLATFLLAIGSFKFTSSRLNSLAVVSVTVWVIRTILRYSNKLARYDLLVKRFLSSKISHRNLGALKYIANEAGSQRALRAALVHSWLCRRSKGKELFSTFNRAQLLKVGERSINGLIRGDKQIPIDLDAAMNDLEELGLMERQAHQPGLINSIQNPALIDTKLKEVWNEIFKGRI